MASSPSGTRLVYVGTWDPTGYQYLTASVSDSEIVADVQNDLSNNQGIMVEASNISRPLISGTEDITLNLLDKLGHNDTEDVRAIVDHSFYTAGSNAGGILSGSALGNPMPSSSRIVSYTQPGQAPTSTGAPPAPPANSAGDTLPSIGNLLDPSQWGTSTWVVLGSVLVGLGLLAYVASRA